MISSDFYHICIETVVIICYVCIIIIIFYVWESSYFILYCSYTYTLQVQTSKMPIMINQVDVNQISLKKSTVILMYTGSYLHFNEMTSMPLERKTQLI